jgi:predicted dienelactone hydrolase
MVHLRRLIRASAAFALGVLSLGLASSPGRAAERVYVEFGPLSRYVSVSSLESFAETGVVDKDLAFYINLMSPENQEDLRTALTATREVDLVTFSQFFNTPMGERALYFIGSWVKTGGQLNGQKAIRAAMIKAAADDGQVSLLEYIQHYPTSSLRFDAAQAARYTRQVVHEADQTVAFVEATSEQSAANASAMPIDITALPDLTQPGPYATRQIELTLQDASRQSQILENKPHTFPATLILPGDLSAIEGTLPVVVISHGLGDSRTSFLDVGAHIASHGFAVVLPEHVGSNRTQREEMKQGLSQETFLAQEFLDRPLDVSFVLDELERTNATNYQGKLDTDRVTAVGHSFGGYTVLALAGAKIDFERLAERCNPEANVVVDLAMLLNCRALELQDDPATAEQLSTQGVRDDRIQLVMAFAPVSNAFSPDSMGQIDIPVMMYGGAFDLAAPLLLQQAVPFSWLQTPEKYLYVAENTSHGPAITSLTSRLFNIDQQYDESVEEGLILTRQINQGLVVAFSQVFLANQEAFRPYLTSAYIEAVSADPFRVNLVREIPEPFGD